MRARNPGKGLRDHEYDYDDDFIDDSEMLAFLGGDRRRTKHSGFFINKARPRRTCAGRATARAWLCAGSRLPCAGRAAAGARLCREVCRGAANVAYIQHPNGVLARSWLSSLCLLLELQACRLVMSSISV